MSGSNLEATVVREHVIGRWLDVLSHLAPELEEALGRLGHHVPCPVHGGEDGFRLFANADMTGGGICNTCGANPDGFALLMWLKGWSFPDALRAVANALGLSEGRAPPSRSHRVACAKERGRDPTSLLAAIDRVWDQSLAPNDRRAAPLRAYLERRGLAEARLDAGVVRFHLALGYWTRDGFGRPRCIGRLPAMVARVMGPDGPPLTLHRTYLTREGGKAPVAEPKKLMAAPGALSGGAIRLFASTKELGVAEGIETALAVHLWTGIPVWSAVSARMLEAVQLPPGIRRVVIWADLDRSGAGQYAAVRLRARLSAEGIETSVKLPPGPLPAGAKGLDWADLWLEARRLRRVA
jgi:phage/plasmid primase-like uncharacterized protein